MNKKYFIEGASIGLRPLALEDVDGNYAFWLNDPEIIQHNSHGRFPMTKEKLSDYVTRSQKNHTMLVLAVDDLASGTHVGNISLQNINWTDRNAELAFLLGEKEFWGKGIMFQAGQLMIQHAFYTLNLHRVYCGTSSENIGMQNLATKLGMNKEGERKEMIFNQGKYFDVYEYGIINK